MADMPVFRRVKHSGVTLYHWAAGGSGPVLSMPARCQLEVSLPAVAVLIDLIPVSMSAGRNPRGQAVPPRRGRSAKHSQEYRRGVCS